MIGDGRVLGIRWQGRLAGRSRKMWYFGGDEQRLQIRALDAKGIKLRTGCAVSRDGVRW